MSKKPKRLKPLKQKANLLEQYKGTHRGSLADLSGKNREEAIAAELSQRMKDQGFSSYVALVGDAVQSEPRLSLLETLQLLNKDTLLTIARTFELKRYSQLRKSDLCTMIFSRLMTIAPEIMEAMLINGSNTLTAFIKRLAEAGGSITVTAADLSRASRGIESLGLPVPHPPYINLYCYDSIFTYVLPKEFVEAYKEIDQPYVDHKRRQQEILFKSAKVSTELYGLISLMDFLNLIMQNDEYELDIHETFDLLTSHIDSGVASFDFYAPGDDDNEDKGVYLAYAAILEDYFDDYDEESEEDYPTGLAEFRRNLISYHDKVERKPFDVAEVTSIDPFGMFLELPSVARLQGLLDTFVPDGEDDYLYADTVLFELYGFARMGVDEDIVNDFLEEIGLPAALITSDLFSKTLAEVLENSPLWLVHGWSIVEFEEQGQKDRDSNRIHYELSSSSHVNHNHSDNHSPFQIIEGGLSDDPGNTQKKKVGRNEPCPCGSGKKYKNCCGKL